MKPFHPGTTVCHKTHLDWKKETKRNFWLDSLKLMGFLFHLFIHIHVFRLEFRVSQFLCVKQTSYFCYCWDKVADCKMTQMMFCVYVDWRVTKDRQVELDSYCVCSLLQKQGFWWGSDGACFKHVASMHVAWTRPELQSPPWLCMGVISQRSEAARGCLCHWRSALHRGVDWSRVWMCREHGVFGYIKEIQAAATFCRRFGGRWSQPCDAVAPTSNSQTEKKYFV